MAFSSASEGEIMDSEGDKATKTRPHPKDSTIDRRSRPRSPLSRSPRPLSRPSTTKHDRPDRPHRPDRRSNLDGAGDDYSHANASDALDYGDEGRPQHNTTGHASKRRHEDDQAGAYSRPTSDSRRLQVRYESGQSGHQSDHRHNAYRSERDSQSRSTRPGYGHGPASYDDRPPPGKRHQSERYRARSRSPRSRSDRDNRQPFERLPEDVDRRRRSSSPSTYDRETTASKSRRPDSTADSTAPTGPEDDAEPVVVDEAKLIEDRRKRREALRAKHRGQNTPLLQKALETNATSLPSNPQADESGARQEHSGPSSANSNSAAPSTVPSPMASLPDSPTSLASPAPFSVANDEELVNPAQASPSQHHLSDGPSAADYDPNMDMQETKLREQRAERDPASVDHDETKKNHQQDSAQVHSAQAPAAREFDMFADDDDDDMFAPEPSAGHKKDDGTQAVRIPEAKQLDRGLLDDWDDPEGYYRIILGELLDDRYHVQTNLGKGVFSAVVRALDTKTDRLVAIKVIRKQESMYKAGMKEIEILQTIADADPDDKKHMIRLERHFEHKGHLCMVFENLSINLREVLKKFGRDIGINIKAVRSYAQQMFLGLSLLRKCEILHADLKPDNVLVNETRSQLKIADLGSAMSARDNEVTDMLVSRFYRAPEIMLGIRHDYAIDMWSIGCTLFELYTGKICFTGPTNNQMLKVIMECRGKIPNRMLKKSEFWPQHFDPDGTFLSQEIDAVARKEFVRRTNITRPIPQKELRGRLFSNAKGLSPADAKELNLFADLLDKCLAVDPARRITPNDALKHGFITRAGLSK